MRGMPITRVMPLLLVLGALLAPAPVQAQGCSMCYTAAAAQSEQGKAALNLAILVLLLPAVAIFSGVFWVAYRHRDWWAEDVPAGSRDSRARRSPLLPVSLPPGNLPLAKGTH